MASVRELAAVSVAAALASDPVEYDAAEIAREAVAVADALVAALAPPPTPEQQLETERRLDLALRGVLASADHLAVAWEQALAARSESADLARYRDEDYETVLGWYWPLAADIFAAWKAIMELRDAVERAQR